METVRKAEIPALRFQEDKIRKEDQGGSDYSEYGSAMR
jgi:hypothetical protein